MSLFVGFYYFKWIINLILCFICNCSSTTTSPSEEPPIDVSQLPESEVYFLEEEAQLLKEEQETFSKDGFSHELPVPFIIVPGDEEQNKLLHDYDMQLRQSTRDSLRLSSQAREGGLNDATKPINHEPGLADLTDHNYNNVMEHAYANTLFYRRYNP